jgi:hypothetical protein
MEKGYVNDVVTTLVEESSSINKIGYDKKGSVLYVEFKTGIIYGYREISEELYEEFLESESKGKFFYSNIRKDSDYFQCKRNFI